MTSLARMQAVGTSDAHFYLALRIRGAYPAVAFPNLQPPLKQLRPVYKALLSATHCSTG